MLVQDLKIADDLLVFVHLVKDDEKDISIYKGFYSIRELKDSMYKCYSVLDIRNVYGGIGIYISSYNGLPTENSSDILFAFILLTVLIICLCIFFTLIWGVFYV